MSADRGPAGAPAIDETTLAALRDAVGAEFLAELVDTFADEAPALLDELRAAVAAADEARAKRAAHSLKSNAGTFGANTLAALARDVELGGIAAASSSDVRGALARELQRAIDALRAARHG